MSRLKAVGGRAMAALVVAVMVTGCVHKAPGLPEGRPAPIINTDRPGTLTR